jgi:hypothetical protein
MRPAYFQKVVGRPQIHMYVAAFANGDAAELGMLPDGFEQVGTGNSQHDDVGGDAARMRAGLQFVDLFRVLWAAVTELMWMATPMSVRSFSNASTGTFLIPLGAAMMTGELFAREMLGYFQNEFSGFERPS